MIGRMVRLNAALIASVLVGASTARVPVADATAVPRPGAKIPSKLLTLERRMRSLSINSERYAIESFVHGPGVTSKHPFRDPPGQRRRSRRSTRRSIGTALLWSAVVEVSESPFLAVARGHDANEPESETRQIGRDSFYQRPEAARFDGGRPWVERKLTDPRTEAIEGLDDAGEWRRSQVGDLIAYIADATSVAEIGPVMVLGHRTTEFSLSLCAPLRMTARPKTGKGFGCAKRIVRVFFETDGLPVHVELVLLLGKRNVTYKTDILATEIPIPVQPPPASETIGEEELLKIERARSRRPSSG